MGGFLFIEAEPAGLWYLARLDPVCYLWCWASQAQRQLTLAQATLAASQIWMISSRHRFWISLLRTG